jgi:hypothetical protein
VDPGAISVLYAHSQFEKAQGFKMDQTLSSHRTKCLQNEWKRKQCLDDNFAKGMKVHIPPTAFFMQAVTFPQVSNNPSHSNIY